MKYKKIENKLSVIIKEMTGISTLELNMIVFIVALLAFIIAPRICTLIHVWDLEVETKKLVAVIRQVQQLALTTRSIYRITFNSPVSYEVQCFDDNNLIYTTVPENTLGVRYNAANEIELDNGITISALTLEPNFTNNELRFNRFGAPVRDEVGDGAPYNNAGAITLIDAAGVTTMNITITMLTGRITFL